MTSISTGAPISIEMLRKLIAFPTVSRDSNLELIQFARDYLKDIGAVLRLTYDEDRRKANLFATLGPAGEPGVVLSGHTDVVPVDGQAWDTDPFTLVEKDGRLYGRGTSDMKSFIAVTLALAPEFARRGLKTPVHFALSYDEEVGCIGVGRLISDLAHAGIKPKSCIVGKPTLMQLGKVSFGTEGSHFQRAGIPTVVCGPGSVAQAHMPNEYVTVDQVLKCEQFMRRLLDRVCAAA